MTCYEYLQGYLPKIAKNILPYVLVSTSAMLSGIVMILRLGAATPMLGTNFGLYVVLSCLFGAASIFGKRGSALKGFIGSVSFGVLMFSFAILAINIRMQSIVLWALVIVLICYDFVRKFLLDRDTSFDYILGIDFISIKKLLKK